ncbi:MAG: deoxycytidylate deaminase, partial [Rhizobacter sp.]
QYPCPKCAQSIIQVGIRRVVSLEKKSHQHRVNEASSKMLADAGVVVEPLADVEPDSAQWSTDLATFIATTTGAPPPGPPGDA